MLFLITLVCVGVVALAGLVLAGQEIISRIEATQTAPLALAPPDTPTAAVFAPTAVSQTESATPIGTIPATVAVTLPATSEVTETPRSEVLFSLNPPAEIDQEPAGPLASQYLLDFIAASYPVNDYYETAVRLSSQDFGERTVTAGPFAVGARQTFITSDGQVEDKEVEAELLAVTENAYFWIETSLGYSQNDVAIAADRFEDEYYPQVIRLFGTEWRPGVDNDPHFSVLHLDGHADNGELGFFDSGDEYPHSINSASNQQELIYLNMENLDLGEDLYYGTLVHELQHLIQWNLDANEPAWMNEGLSQLVELMVGLDTVDTAVDYLENPQTRLNTWEYEDEDVVFAHYGAAYLFAVYLWEQLGEEAIVDLARHPANGLAAVSAILGTYRPETNLEQFLAEWTVATFVDSARAGANFSYQNLDLRRPSYAIEIKDAPFDAVSELNQLGVHYVDLRLEGEMTVSFAGDTRAELVMAQPHSGEQMWFAPPVDEADLKLTGAFDLTGLTTATLNFWTWYDLEEDFDYGYVSISTDVGSTWRLLVPEHAQPGEYGPSFNGQSVDEADSENGWVPESISLNNFSGQEVLIRFEVLTDSALTGRGFAIDDVAIPELGYRSDAENGVDGWAAEGFVVSGRFLPQQWRIHLIQPGTTPRITPLPLSDLNQGEWRFNLGPEGGVLAITALTPFTSQATSYWLDIERFG